MRQKNIIFLLVFIFCLTSCFGGHKRKKHKKKNNEVTWVTTNESNENDDDEYVVNDVDIKQIATVHVGLPLKYISVTSEYGEREDPITGKKSIHSGIDLSAGLDTTVAMMPGVVESVGQNSVAGKFVTIKHGALSVTYCHLSETLVKKNYKVIAGSKVGITGSTGRATGEHLHLACKLNGKPFDPYILLQLLRSELSEESID